MKIELPIDQLEAAEFAAYLTTRGHDVKQGNSTGTYVDGFSTNDPHAAELMRALWDQYCNA